MDSEHLYVAPRLRAECKEERISLIPYDDEFDQSPADAVNSNPRSSTPKDFNKPKQHVFWKESWRSPMPATTRVRAEPIDPDHARWQNKVYLDLKLAHTRYTAKCKMMDIDSVQFQTFSSLMYKSKSLIVKPIPQMSAEEIFTLIKNEIESTARSESTRDPMEKSPRMARVAR
jgi:hypothetical protein